MLKINYQRVVKIVTLKKSRINSYFISSSSKFRYSLEPPFGIRSFYLFFFKKLHKTAVCIVYLQNEVFLVTYVSRWQL